MLPFPLPRIFSPIYCDDGSVKAGSTSRALGAISSITQVVKPQESELRRWRRTFDANAKVIGNERWAVARAFCYRVVRSSSFVMPWRGSARFLDRDSFVEAIAPKEDLTKIGRAQFSILFKVADYSKRGLVSWDDFAVFQTLLKRPDADYWIAFQYFDV